MDKIKVNLSYLCYSTLLHDAEAFNVVKKNGEINMNYFYNEIIVHLYEKRWAQINQTKKYYHELLSQYLPPKKLDSIVNDISRSINENFNDFSKQYHSYSILIRPRKEYDLIFQTILENHLINDTISNYFRSIFIEYCSLSQDERELLLFENNVNTINKAISMKSQIKIVFNDQTILFSPYCITATKEKLYNFVIGRLEPSKIISLHLYKIKKILPLKESFSFSNEEINQFEAILSKGPQYFSDNYCSSCIEFTPTGLKKWKKIYLNRPLPCAIEGNRYYFDCNFEQQFQYFSRFGKDIKVIYPKSLIKALTKFHKEAYENLIEEKKKIVN